MSAGILSDGGAFAADMQPPAVRRRIVAERAGRSPRMHGRGLGWRAAGAMGAWAGAEAVRMPGFGGKAAKLGKAARLGKTAKRREGCQGRNACLPSTGLKADKTAKTANATVTLLTVGVCLAPVLGAAR